MNRIRQLIHRNDDLQGLVGDEKKLVWINGLFNFAATLSQVFVNVYLYEYTGSLVVMSIYTIIRIGLFPFAFTFGGKWAYKARFSPILSSGLVLIIASLAFILMYSDLMAIYPNLVYVVALLTGLGEGLYWFSINSCNQLVPRANVRGLYLANVGIFNNIGALIAPVISSLIITFSPSDTSGYIHIFEVVIVIYIVITCVALGFKVRANDQRFKLLQCLSLKQMQWRISMVSVFFYGIRDSFTLTLSGLLIYKASGSSGSLYSNLLIVFSFLAISAFYYLAKRLTNSNFFSVFRIGMILTVSASLVIVYINNIWGAIFFGLANAVASAFYVNPFTEIIMKSIACYDKKNHVGLVIAKETYQSLGRCFGMGLIVLFYLLFPNHDVYLYISVTLCSLCPLLVYWLIRRLNDYRRLI